MTRAKPGRTLLAVGELERLVRAGKFNEVRRNLREIQFKRIPREEAVIYANLARRVDLGKISLRILNPIVRAEKQRKIQAKPEEKIEYAASLRNLGATSEATEILESIDRQEYPQAGFQLAICLIHEWRYQEAIPLLREYLRSFRAPTYAMYIGQLNLAAALVYEEEFDEVPGLIGELLQVSERSQLSLLHRNCLELAARFEVSIENWDGAIQRLTDSRRVLDQDPDSVYSLWAAKWLAVAGAMKSGRITRDLLRARERAIEKGVWETVRDCDYYAARATRDRQALIRLYFGTPFESYRRKILDTLGAEDPRSDLPEHFLWNERRSAEPGLVFDLTEARCGGKDSINARLSPGQELHRLLIILCQDFYKPVPLLSIFSKLFPDEQFNPESSPHRVHLVVARLRHRMATNSLPLAIDRISDSYRLSFDGPCFISIPREPLPLESRELQFLRLRRIVDLDSFTINDAIAALDTSKASIKRLLKWAASTGKIKLEGRTHRARYRVIV